MKKTLPSSAARAFGCRNSAYRHGINQRMKISQLQSLKPKGPRFESGGRDFFPIKTEEFFFVFSSFENCRFSKNIYTSLLHFSYMGFINIVSNKPKPASSGINSGKPAKPMQPSLPKISKEQMIAAGLIVLGLIFLGIAIMSW